VLLALLLLGRCCVAVVGVVMLLLLLAAPAPSDALPLPLFVCVGGLGKDGLSDDCTHCYLASIFAPPPRTHKSH
jgi:hypothetical protein